MAFPSQETHIMEVELNMATTLDMKPSPSALEKCAGTWRDARHPYHATSLS